jgi:hypothetical protein
MPSETATPVHPFSAAWGARPSAVKHEIFDLAILKERYHSKKCGRAGSRRDTRPRPGGAVVDPGGDERRPTTPWANHAPE